MNQSGLYLPYFAWIYRKYDRHSKQESTVCYLGIEMEDALEMAEHAPV